jgi:hypothetical protein
MFDEESSDNSRVAAPPGATAALDRLRQVCASKAYVSNGKRTNDRMDNQETPDGICANALCAVHGTDTVWPI